MEPKKVWDLPIIDGAILKGNIPFETHKRGKNWLAVISRDPKSPGGISRSFMERGHGEYAYIAENIPVGSALECGADYYSGGGNPSRNRTYWLLTARTPSKWVLAEYETSSDLFKAQKEFVPPSDKTRVITLPQENTDAL